MSLKRIVEPTVEPLTLTEAKTHLRITDTSQDTEVTRNITTVRRLCEHETQRSLTQQDWELKLDRFPEAIELLRPPIMGVISVTYYDRDQVLQTLDPASYYLDVNGIQVGWIVPAYSVQWPETLAAANSVTVQYRAGFGTTAADVPGPLKQWMLIMLGTLDQNRESVVAAAGISSTTLDFVPHLLDEYRVQVF